MLGKALGDVGCSCLQRALWQPRSAKLWRTLMRPDHVTEELSTATRPSEAPPVASVERLHRLHAFQMFMTYTPFQAVEHPSAVDFFRHLAPA